MKNGKCPAGEYYCYTNKECKPIPDGFMVDPAGMLRKENGASIDEEGLRDWFGKSKSKDGKGGWVNVVTGGTCASDEPGEGTPKCVSSAKRASMTKAERLSAARRKKAADPGQQSKTGAAKPTYVSTDKPKKKMNESKQRDHEYSMARSELSTVINAANRLKKKMGKGEGNIEAWVQSKITKAADYLDSAADYVDSGEMSEQNEPIDINKGKRREARDQAMKDMGKTPFEPDPNIRRVKGQKILDRLLGQPDINEESDKKGKGSGTKDACYHKVKSRYSVWPSAYASGALVKCRKVGADNWGNKSESLSPMSKRILKELNLDEKCWPGYEKKGMKTMFGKRYPNCVKKKTTNEDYTRINENGQTYSVMLMWRGKTYTFQMFVASMKRPSKQEIEKEVQKVYPDAKVMMFMPKMYDPAAPTIMIPENYESEGEVIGEMGPMSGLLIRGALAAGTALAGKAVYDKARGAADKIKQRNQKMQQQIDQINQSYEPEGEVLDEVAAWQRSEGKKKSGGLNEKGRKSYERENPGSDLKAPSKKVGNPRRASFCARMKGMKKKLTSAKTANDPNSRINKSLRAWNC